MDPQDWPGLFRALVLPITPTRWHRSLRTAIVLTLAVFISLLLQFEQVAWTVITILILSMPEVGTTWQKALERIGGTLVGAIGGIAMIAMFPQSTIMVLLLFGATLVVGLYLSMTMITSMYTYFMVVVTMIIVSTAAWDAPLDVQQLGLERFQSTLLGVLCVTFGATVLWPVRAEDQLIDSMVQRVTRARERLGWVVGVLRSTNEVGSQPLDVTPTPLAHQLSLFQAASMESHVIRKHRETIMVLLTVVDRIGSSSAEIDQETAASASELLESSCRDTVCEVLESLMNVLSCIESARADQQPKLAREDVDRVNALVDRLEEQRAGITSSDLLSLTSSVARMGRMANHLQVLEQWCAGDLVDTTYLTDQTPLVEARLNRSIFEPFRHIDELAMHTAIKASVAAMVALLVVASMHWGSVGATAVVTCVLVMLPTIGGSLAKAMQRIGGAFIGAVFGVAVMAALGPNTIDVAPLLLIVAGVGFVAQWVMLARWDIAYAGMQFAFAFAITALAYSSATENIDSGIDRVFGIFVGMVVAILVLWLIWPVRASQRVLFSLGEAARLMGRFIQRGLLTEEQEQEQRPLNGFRYRIAWLLADAYRFRQEARFERRLLPTAQAPALEMGMLLQSLNFRIHAVVQNRLEHEQVRAYGKLEPVHALLEDITQRLEDIGDLLEYGTPLPESRLESGLKQAHEAMDGVEGMTPADMLLVRTQVGYYTEVIRLLPSIEEEAQRNHDLFGRT
jgi:uncharacterized membrane protein YccC